MASTDFINECKNRANANRLGQLIVDGIETPISNKNNLQKISIDDSCYVDGNIIGSVFVKKLTAEFIGIEDNNQLVDKQLYAQIGVKYADNSTEYIDMGNYTIERPKDEKTANYSQITAYDSLAENIDKKYVCGIDYSQGNITLSNLYQDVCKQLGLSPKTLTFLNSNIPISNNPFANGETNRTVLQSVAKVACSFVTIDTETNEIELSWLSENEEPDYEFAENDYAILDGGIVSYGPINSVVIKNSVIDDENVAQTDDTSISVNGEHSLIINEDYILYNAQLRQQAIIAIFNRLNGLKYVDCKLTSYYGKPFLKIGSKIRINSKGSYFDTYVLKHKFTYDGTFTSVIESPVLTEQQIKNKQDISLQEVLKNTQISVNKQEGKINLLSQQIIDTTKTETGIGSVTIDSKLDNVGYQLTIRNACQLFPSSKLYPSSTLYPLGRWLRVTYADGTYSRCKLPVLALRQLNDVYDEMIITSGKVQVIKRIGVNEDESLCLLDEPITTDKEDVDVVLKQGINKIELESFPNANLTMQYMIESIYSNTFSTKKETSAEIEVANNKINSEVNEKLSDYSTTTEMNNKITQEITKSENKISLEVAKKVDDEDYTGANIILKINDDTSGAQIDADIINLNANDILNLIADNVINLTSKNIVISSDNFTVDANGNVQLISTESNPNFVVKDKNGNTLTVIGNYIIFEDNDGNISNYNQNGFDLSDNNNNIQLMKIGDVNYLSFRQNGRNTVYLADNYGSDSNSALLLRNKNIDGNYCKVMDDSINLYYNNSNKIALYNTGTIQCVELIQTSLEKNKKNFEKYGNALEEIKKIDIYKYNLEDETDNHKKHLGFVIGDNYNYSHEITAVDKNGEEIGVDNYSMTSLCLQAIKEQQEQIELLKQEIELLKNKESDK